MKPYISNIRPDTLPAFKALLDALGGNPRQTAQVIKTAPEVIYRVLNGKQKPPTLDTLHAYARNAFEETGLRLTFEVDPTGLTDYEIS